MKPARVGRRRARARVDAEHLGAADREREAGELAHVVRAVASADDARRDGVHRDRRAAERVRRRDVREDAEHADPPARRDAQQRVAAGVGDDVGPVIGPHVDRVAVHERISEGRVGVVVALEAPEVGDDAGAMRPVGAQQRAVERGHPLLADQRRVAQDHLRRRAPRRRGRAAVRDEQAEGVGEHPVRADGAAPVRGRERREPLEHALLLVPAPVLALDPRDRARRAGAREALRAVEARAGLRGITAPAGLGDVDVAVPADRNVPRVVEAGRDDDRRRRHWRALRRRWPPWRRRTGVRMRARPLLSGRSCRRR